jgi:effector-binding domain-containing protein
MRARSLILASLAVVLVPSCKALGTPADDPLPALRARSVPPLGTVAPTPIEANWKERLEQPYVFLERRGDYRNLAEAMDRLVSEARALVLEAVGPPFALFLDDPGKTPLSELRARVCIPVDGRPARLGQLRYEILPRSMVVYARVQGTHADVARAYPALFAYLRQLGWQPGGPIREVYLSGRGAAELLTEVQIPWIVRPE